MISRLLHRCARLQPLLVQAHTKKKIDVFSHRFFQLNSPVLGELMQFNLADIGEGIKEVVVTEWHVSVDDHVKEFDNICEVKSDKASVTITSRYEGVIRTLHHDVNSIVQVGSPLVDIEVVSDLTDSKTEDPAPLTPVVTSVIDEKATVSPSVPRNSSNILATPAVRKHAKENNIELRNVRASGKDGRVLKEDILSYLEANKSVRSPSKDGRDSLPNKEPVSFSATSDSDRCVELNFIQRTMKKTMTESNRIPTFQFSDEICVDKLISFRDSFNRSLQGIKLSYMPYLLKALSLALLDYPMLNAHTDPECIKLTYKGSHNIGIAMDTKDGLLVPNVKHIQQLGIVDIAKEIARLMELGKEGKLSMEDLTGGTITLSNVGSIGGTYAHPIILPYEVAIGGLGRIQKLPRFNDTGDLVARQVVYVCWSADHRVLDGATVARFSNHFKSFIENPELMLVKLR